MRTLALLGLGLVASLTVTSFAEAQERKPLRVDVQKRSYFDVGNVAPVGSMNRYATQTFTASPQYSYAGDRFGEGALPSRIGGGTNPFAFSFWTPGF
ncbi:MAG: hypothetical protein ACRCWO_07005 [Bosea sp. (in: a-proteobacteria)]